MPHWARDGHPVVHRVADGEAAAAGAIVWYEFLSGPLAPNEADLARAFVQGRIIDLGLRLADADLSL